MAVPKQQAPRVKKVPMRQCVGCQEMTPKREMLRVVRTPDGAVLLDPTGKKSGRGAYIHPRQECLARAVKGKRLERALGVPIGDEVYAELQRSLPPAPPAGGQGAPPAGATGSGAGPAPGSGQVSRATGQVPPAAGGGM